jgi:hypothetical protein
MHLARVRITWLLVAGGYGSTHGRLEIKQHCLDHAFYEQPDVRSRFLVSCLSDLRHWRYVLFRCSYAPFVTDTAERPRLIALNFFTAISYNPGTISYKPKYY